MKTVVKKGYTLEVKSWENDGDNYRTKFKTVQNKETAEALVKMCRTVFQSCNNGDGGIGNTCDGANSETNEIILDFMKEYPNLSKHIPEPTDEQLIDICMNYNYELMGGSEWYYSRIAESVTCTYAPEDVILQEVTF